jgi:hypothetical protein
MSSPPPERAEALALALREAHPEAEPYEVDPGVLGEWLREAGADPEDDRLAAAALVAWEGLLD